MTKMAAVPIYIYGKNHNKSSSPEPETCPMILKLNMHHWGLKLYKVYINDDHGLTLTYFMVRSNWVTCTFEWGKLSQSHLMEENLQQRTILTE